MNQVRQGLDNQAIGLLPLLLFMFLDNFFSYKISFSIAALFCLLSFLAYHLLKQGRVYQFMLLPTAATFICYSGFLLMHLEPVLFTYSPLIAELLLVVVLAVSGLTKNRLFRSIRVSKMPIYQRASLRTSLNEYFFMAQMTQNIYTLHLFLILFYSILPDEMKHPTTQQFLYREVGLLLGLFLLVYEQIRLALMQGSLKKEMWLPVLNDEGKVVGCIARSVSRILPKKYFHPIVRIILSYKGMLYLVKRPSDEFLSPDLLDHPLHSYVVFRHSIQETVLDLTEKACQQQDALTPRFLIRYVFENSRVKHLVSLYVIHLQSEDQISWFKLPAGKFWLARQIEENLHKGVFSEYFEMEFPYLKNTLLFADQVVMEEREVWSCLPYKG